MLRFAAIVLALILLPQTLWARTPVRFVFEIGECASSPDPARCHPYGRQFPRADQTWIHEKVAESVRKMLARELPPFDFESSVPEQYLLRARLIDGPIATGRTAVFSLALDDATEPLEIEYRDAVRYGAPIPTRDVFAQELIDRLVSEIKRRRQELIDKLLSRLPLSSGAHPLPTQKMFILGFAEDELKIGKDSKFRIEAVDEQNVPWDFETVSRGASQAGANVPHEYELKVLALVVAPTDSIARLQSGAPLTAGMIYLLRYEPPRPRLQPVPGLGTR
jgi:hypothetical protein